MALPLFDMFTTNFAGKNSERGRVSTAGLLSNPPSSKDEHPEYGSSVLQFSFPSRSSAHLCAPLREGSVPRKRRIFRDFRNVRHVPITLILPGLWALAARRSALFRSKCLTWNGCTATIRARAPANRVTCRKSMDRCRSARF